MIRSANASARKGKSNPPVAGLLVDSAHRGVCIVSAGARSPTHSRGPQTTPDLHAVRTVRPERIVTPNGDESRACRQERNREGAERVFRSHIRDQTWLQVLRVKPRTTRPRRTVSERGAHGEQGRTAPPTRHCALKEKATSLDSSAMISAAATHAMAMKERPLTEAASHSVQSTGSPQPSRRPVRACSAP